MKVAAEGCFPHQDELGRPATGGLALPTNAERRTRSPATGSLVGLPRPNPTARRRASLALSTDDIVTVFAVGAPLIGDHPYGGD